MIRIRVAIATAILIGVSLLLLAKISEEDGEGEEQYVLGALIERRWFKDPSNHDFVIESLRSWGNTQARWDEGSLRVLLRKLLVVSVSLEGEHFKNYLLAHEELGQVLLTVIRGRSEGEIRTIFDQDLPR